MKNKKLHLEVLRVIACFFVIFNHTSSNGFFLFAKQPSGSTAYWIYMFISIFCKFAVPMFFAISGALLLTKKESLSEIFRKRILKILIVLIAFSALYYVFSIRADLSKGSFIDFLKSLYSGDICGAYWFLYAYIAYLLVLPFLRAIAVNLENKYFYYLFICVVLLGSIVTVAEYLIWHGNLTLNSSFDFSWLGAMVVVYPLIGYFIENRLDIGKIRKWIPLLWLADIAGMIITCITTDMFIKLTGSNNEDTAQPFHYCFALVTVTALFITAKAISSHAKECKKNKLISKIIASMGGATFGIYLIHVPIMDVTFYRIIPFMNEQLKINAMISAMLFTLSVFIMAYIITFLLKLIPGVRKIL